MELKTFLVELVPFAAMVSVECFDVGLTTLSKAAMSHGLSHFIFIVYANAIASAILLPCNFIINRTKRPPVTVSFLCKLFLLSLVGITVMQNCVITGVNYSSPTLASALGNLIPAFTFLLAFIFRMEKLDVRSLRSQVKVLGTLVSIGGAVMLTLYKGPAIGAGSSEQNHNQDQQSSPPTNNWIIGGSFIVTGSLCVAIMLISQAAILKGYPSEFTLVSFYCFFGTIQCAVVSLVAERNNPGAWKIKPGIQLISIVYAAVFGNVVTYGAAAWCIRRKGPVFVAMFKPVGISISAFMGVIFLGETFHVGSLIGAIIIVVGFYGVLWAQSKEEEKCEVYKEEGPRSSSEKTPLLDIQSHIVLA